MRVRMRCTGTRSSEGVSVMEMEKRRCHEIGL